MEYRGTYDETRHFRQLHVASSCGLHYSDEEPLKMVRALNQYMYSEDNKQYLDCTDTVAHVGHCHPYIVNAAKHQMSQLGCYQSCEVAFDKKSAAFIEKFTSLFPENLTECFFTSSGSAANDIALQLARCYTGHKHILALEGAFHGGGVATIYDITNRNGILEGDTHKKDWIVIAPSPTTYRGKYSHLDPPDAAVAYSEEVRKLLKQSNDQHKYIGTFFMEGVSTGSKLIPPDKYYETAFRHVRSQGGLCVADEIGAGFGRLGKAFWSFQLHNVVPDIVTVGKSIGNGYPMAAAITTKEIAEKFRSKSQCPYSFSPNAMMCAVGSSVLDILKDECLIHNASHVGEVLQTGFLSLKEKLVFIGDVRGSGLLIGVDIVENRLSYKPAQQIAKAIVYGLKKQLILVALTGVDKNIISISPSMCFSEENARHLLCKFDEVASAVNTDWMTGTPLSGVGQQSLVSRDLIPVEILTGRTNVTTHNTYTEEELEILNELD